jgi:hypothetical protein
MTFLHVIMDANNYLNQKKQEKVLDEVQEENHRKSSGLQI